MPLLLCPGCVQKKLGVNEKHKLRMMLESEIRGLAA
jgi:hypothetical protein